MNAHTGFACPGCGRRYAWRPEYEGRELTCTCGGKVQPVAGGKKAVTVASGYVVGHRARPQVAQDGGDGSVVREWAGPIALLVVGVVGRGIEIGVMRPLVGHGPGAVVTTEFAVGGIVLGAVAVAIGVLGTAQLMGSELDGLWAVVRKVGGLAAFAAFAATLCANIDREPGHFRGLLVALHVVLLIYFVGISYLLKMDLLEALLATVVAIAVQVGLFLAVAQALPGTMGRLMYYAG